MKKLKAILRERATQLWIFWSLWFLSIAALALWALWDAGFRFNVSESMPAGMYRLSPEQPQRGDAVAYCLRGETARLALRRGYVTAGSCPSGVCPLLKTAAGLPGDALQQGHAGISVNGRLQPQSAVFAEDSQGRGMAGALLPAVVPDGMALLLSDHPGGFDSRYFGLVPLAELLRATPVFTL